MYLKLLSIMISGYVEVISPILRNLSFCQFYSCLRASTIKLILSGKALDILSFIERSTKMLNIINYLHIMLNLTLVCFNLDYKVVILHSYLFKHHLRIERVEK